MKAFTFAQCVFYLREPGVRGGFRYTHLDQLVEPGDDLPTAMPPQIGDLVNLAGVGLFRVVDRQWSYPAYGSAYWPYGQDPKGRVRLDLMVERAKGMFVDEEAGE
ncbi:hypothetical protein AB0K21_21925 [Streptosporangium sp. NPDC049248]|uniref:hypothetical protein n=1 Tax=Streptosporangium sp. NPDC049248 TaxID=3155651 RepID=UPI00341D4F75